jgi:hypothetical protein
VRTLRRQRHLVRLVDVRRRSPRGAHAIRGSRLAAWAPRRRDDLPAREGRSLAIHRAPRRVELVSQLIVFAPQPLPLGFRPSQILFELLDAARLVVNDLLRITWRDLIALWHAPVMPDLRAQYKRKRGPAVADPLT